MSTRKSARRAPPAPQASPEPVAATTSSTSTSSSDLDNDGHDDATGRFVEGNTEAANAVVASEPQVPNDIEATVSDAPEPAPMEPSLTDPVQVPNDIEAAVSEAPEAAPMEPSVSEAVQVPVAGPATGNQGVQVPTNAVVEDRTVTEAERAFVAAANALFEAGVAFAKSSETPQFFVGEGFRAQFVGHELSMLTAN